MGSFAGQDRWVLETLGYPTGATFVDLGSGDGITFNSTYLLEKDYGWSGVCVEGNPTKYSSLVQNRSCSCDNIIIYNYDGTCKIDENGRISDTGTDVDCKTLSTILNETGIPPLIDYMSINIAGRELDVLKTIDFNSLEIKMLVVDHDYYFGNMIYKWEIFWFLESNGFRRVASDVYCLDEYAEEYGRQPYQDWYINTNLL